MNRRSISDRMKKNSKTYRAAIRTLRIEASRVRDENREKYRNKIDHLKKKYRVDEEEKLKEVPKELEELSSLSIFSKEKFEEIEMKSYKVQKIGDIKTSDAEDRALSLHPKCAVMERLSGDDLEFEK